MCAMLTLCACAQQNVGIITPVSSDAKADVIAAFEGGGVSVKPSDTAQLSIFQYRWQEPFQNVRVWAELYRDGQLVSDPVELKMSDITSPTGMIALFSEEIDGTAQDFALFCSNGQGSDAKVQVRTGTAELGEAMSPVSTVSVDDTQIAELGENNVLLVMHDGPDLDTEMENSLDDTAQLIAGSTYTLVLNCSFA